MTRTEIEATIEEIAKNAFAYLYDAYHGETKGGVIFPNYTHGKNAGEIRVSEQELKCAFIEELRKEKPGWFYAVETPTERKYRFKEKDNICVNEEIGQSAQFDLTIYDENRKLLAQIEFKAHARTTVDQYEKDFLKLAQDCQDESVSRYFIQLFHKFDGTSEKRVCSKLSDCKKRVEGIANVHYKYCILDGSGKISW